jgi:5-oxoprolinase (ATP-hydrolysing) subunit A
VAVDLNSDVGESYGVWRIGDDAAMLRIVSSANVACGFHGGDPTTLRAACATAASHGVTIGAQVSYPDLAGFGRRFIDIDPKELRDAVLYQLGALDAFAQVAGSEVDYVKPHGALYHATIDNLAQAEAVVAAAAEYDPSLAILGQQDSELLAAAERAGLDAVSEGYVDRAYRPDGRLVPRSEAGAVITDVDAAAAQAVRIAVDGEVVTTEGEVISLHARSLCVHGDTPGAVAIATAARQALEAAGVGVYCFCG